MITLAQSLFAEHLRMLLAGTIDQKHRIIEMRLKMSVSLTLVGRIHLLKANPAQLSRRRTQIDSASTH
jgi:hypothetical protein